MSAIVLTGLLPGFADPVRDSQSTFRSVLDAMARPGRIHTLTLSLAPPAPLDPAVAALLLTLIDAETPFFLDPAAAAAREWIVFHCGAKLVGPAEAEFALALGPPPFEHLCTGSDEAPERSATLILQVAALGEGDQFRLDGPGLATHAMLEVTGLPPDFTTIWAANRRLFPRGFDVILAAGSRLAALPRTTRMEAV